MTKFEIVKIMDGTYDIMCCQKSDEDLRLSFWLGVNQGEYYTSTKTHRRGDLISFDKDTKLYCPNCSVEFPNYLNIQMRLLQS